MIFVPDCESALRTVHRHLKPGSPFALQEYIAYETMALCPDRPSMERVVQAIFHSWQTQGGDPNRGRMLPAALEKCGFSVQRVEPMTRTARPQDPLWDWPDGFFKSFLPRLVQAGHLQQTEADQFFSDWDEACTLQGSFFLAPTVVNIVAKRN
jgi:hypothetical protein